MPTCRAADQVAHRFLHALRVAGGMPRNLRAAKPLPIERPTRVSQSFGYYGPGQLLSGTGFRGQGGRADYTGLFADPLSARGRSGLRHLRVVPAPGSRAYSSSVRNQSRLSSCGASPTAVARLAVVVHGVVAEDADRAGRRLREPGRAVDQRRLAGAVGPEQAEELALLDLQRDALERLGAGRVALDQVFDLQGVHCGAR